MTQGNKVFRDGNKNLGDKLMTWEKKYLSTAGEIARQSLYVPNKIISDGENTP